MQRLIREGHLHILINSEDKKLTEIEKLKKIADDLKRGKDENLHRNTERDL